MSGLASGWWSGRDGAGGGGAGRGGRDGGRACSRARLSSATLKSPTISSSRPCAASASQRRRSAARNLRVGVVVGGWLGGGVAGMGGENETHTPLSRTQQNRPPRPTPTCSLELEVQAGACGAVASVRHVHVQQHKGTVVCDHHPATRTHAGGLWDGHTEARAGRVTAALQRSRGGPRQQWDTPPWPPPHTPRTRAPPLAVNVIVLPLPQAVCLCAQRRPGFNRIRAHPRVAFFLAAGCPKGLPPRGASQLFGELVVWQLGLLWWRVEGGGRGLGAGARVCVCGPAARALGASPPPAARHPPAGTPRPAGARQRRRPTTRGAARRCARWPPGKGGASPATASGSGGRARLSTTPNAAPPPPRTAPQCCACCDERTRPPGPAAAPSRIAIAAHHAVDIPRKQPHPAAATKRLLGLARHRGAAKNEGGQRSSAPQPTCAVLRRLNEGQGAAQPAASPSPEPPAPHTDSPPARAAAAGRARRRAIGLRAGRWRTGRARCQPYSWRVGSCTSSSASGEAPRLHPPAAGAVGSSGQLLSGRCAWPRPLIAPPLARARGWRRPTRGQRAKECAV